MAFDATYDACVLHPAGLRDLLVRLATTGMFRAHWSADILDEMVRSVLRRRPDLTEAQLARTRQLMCDASPGLPHHWLRGAHRWAPPPRP